MGTIHSPADAIRDESLKKGREQYYKKQLPIMRGKILRLVIQHVMTAAFSAVVVILLVWLTT